MTDNSTNVIEFGDQNTPVKASQFPSYAKFPFEFFNPVQSRIFEFYPEDCNALIAAATSAGKTVCAEMFMSHEVRVRGGKAVYLAPLKALAQEKLQDWTDPNHHFNDLKVSICTGDYRLTKSRKQELEDANILVFSTEMLNSRCRNYKSESNDFLKQIGTVIVDESHLLTVPGRGDHLEVGLMKLTAIAPNARIIFLSATMPNVSEIAEWLTTLNGKKSYLLKSTYRPCPLGIHWEEYTPESRYEDTEKAKAMAALQILEEHRDDTFLFFVHTKRTGKLMLETIQSAGFKAEFHNADLTKEDRIRLETDRREGKLQCLVATSTLAWGVNLPARRVVIVGVHRGMQEVDTWDIWQMAGRAGRPKYDPRGDVYILIPDNKAPEHMRRIQQHQPIRSRLLDSIGSDPAHYKILAFHLVSEIHHGNIKTKAEMHSWFSRTLAHHQANKLDDEIVDSTLELLVKSGAILEIDGVYKASMIGMISSMFYFSPFDVSDLKRNFKRLFAENTHNNDLAVAMALGNIDTLRMGIVSKAERVDIAPFAKNIEEIYGEGTFTDPAMKGGYAYYRLLTGMDGKDVKQTDTMSRMLQWDFPRLSQVLTALDSMSGKWGMSDYFKGLQVRVQYGVGSNLVKLCSIPDVGKIRAQRLWEKGIKTPEDVMANASNLHTVLNLNEERTKKIVDAARGMVFGI